MNWIKFPATMPGMELWGTIREPWQYVISYDHEFKIWGASAKVLSLDDDMREIISLGAEHATREEAEGACLLHYQSTTL